MSSQLTEKELGDLMPSELVQHETPIPTQIVSSDEFYPDPQNERQREVEARLLAMADDLGGKHGMDMARRWCAILKHSGTWLWCARFARRSPRRPGPAPSYIRR